MSRWGDEKTLHFISCYRKHECLWNPTSYYYKRQVTREKAYTSLLEEFNDDKLTVQMLKTKIKNLRTTYHQELNKIKYSRLSGATPVYQPSLAWFNALDAFLGNITNRQQVKLTQQRTSQQMENIKHEPIPLMNVSSLAEINYEDTELEQPETEQEPARKHARLVANNLMTHDDDSDAERFNPASPWEDEFHFFGMNVAAQLRTLPLHVALRLQTEFHNALYLARVDQDHTGADVHDTTMHMKVEVSDSEAIDHDVDNTGHTPCD